MENSLMQEDFSDSSSGSSDVNEYKLQNSKKSTTENDTANGIYVSLNNINKILVPYSKTNIKKHFCIYCKKLQCKISRHLFLKHKNEEDVKRAFAFPKKSEGRMKIINNIRKAGDFEHNTSANHNSGVLIVSRQQQSKNNNNVDDYVCCSSCKGFFSKTAFRRHKSKCSNSKGSRTNLIESRRLTQYIHSAANNVLKTIIFPVLRDDEITKSIRYDKLVIEYGNCLTENHSSQQHEMIRSHLRLLGRFIIDIKKLDPTINELKDIYKLHLFTKCIKAILNVANWNETQMKFETPAVAQNLTSLIKKCGKRLRVELIKEKREDLKIEVENFLLLWEEEISSINKKTFEQRTHKKSPSSGRTKRCRRTNAKIKTMSLFGDVNGEIDENTLENSTESTTEKDGIGGETISSIFRNVNVENNSENSNEETLNLPTDRMISSSSSVISLKDYSLPIPTTNSTDIFFEQGNFSDSNSRYKDMSSFSDCNESMLENAKKCTTENDNTANGIDVSLNINKILIPYSKTNIKKHFCIYCKKLQSKISRHLFLKHKNEEDVKRAFAFPKKSEGRMKIINNIRKAGDFEHNTSANHNSGVLIVSRQQQSKYNNNVDDYVCCSSCKGFFSKKTLRLHKSNCGNSKGSRTNLIESRRLTQYIHSAANNVLKTIIFPVLRDDEITKSIRYDKLVIEFGNCLAEKHSSQQHERIRAHLRLLGRFKIYIKKLDPTINELKDIYKLHMFDKCIKAILNVANWNETLMKFETPAVAQNVISLIKKCGKILRAELIKEEREDLNVEVENFLLLWEEEIPLIYLKSIEKQTYKKKSPRSKIKRCRWSEKEREAISSIFGDLGSLKRLPTLKECLNAVRQSTALRKRTPAQVKSWIDNQRRYKME